jgi:hypothetical protein
LQRIFQQQKKPLIYGTILGVSGNLLSSRIKTAL